MRIPEDLNAAAGWGCYKLRNARSVRQALPLTALAGNTWKTADRLESRAVAAAEEMEKRCPAGMMGVRLITEAVLSSFAELVYHNQRRAYRLWLITPWLNYDDTKGDAVRMIHEALRDTQCSMTVITRPPRDVYHQQAIDLLRTLKTTVYLCPNLHTKLYILECDGFRAAVLGSPNLTTRGDRRNREIAVEFKTVLEGGDDGVSTIVSDLTDYASALRGEDDVGLM